MLQEQIERSDKVVRWILTSGRQVRVKRTRRSLLTFASIQLAIEHHAAMVYLAKGKHFASLLALARPVYEANLWAAWTLHIATEEQLLLLAKGKLALGISDMVKALDKEHFIEEPMWEHMKPIVKKMHGFTHGGFEHLQHRIHEKGVAASYPDELIVDALQVADAFAIMALMEGPAIDQDIELGDRLVSEGVELLDMNNRVEK